MAQSKSRSEHFLEHLSVHSDEAQRRRDKAQATRLAHGQGLAFIISHCYSGHVNLLHFLAHMQLHTDEGQKRREMTQAKLMAHGQGLAKAFLSQYYYIYFLYSYIKAYIQSLYWYPSLNSHFIPTSINECEMKRTSPKKSTPFSVFYVRS